MTPPAWPPARKQPRCTGGRWPTAPDTTGPSPTPRPPAAAPWTPGPRIAELLEPADPDQALAALETALGHDPYNEYLYQRIMRLQAAAGRPDAVRRTLRLLETRLTELGVTPGPQTRQAAAALLGMPGAATTQQRPAAARAAAARPGCPPAPARPPPRPVTRSPARLRAARVPPADSKPRPRAALP